MNSPLAFVNSGYELPQLRSLATMSMLRYVWLVCFVSNLPCLNSVSPCESLLHGQLLVEEPYERSRQNVKVVKGYQHRRKVMKDYLHDEDRHTKGL